MFYLDNLENEIKRKGFLTGWMTNYIQSIVQSREWLPVACQKVLSHALDNLFKTSDWIKEKKYTLKKMTRVWKGSLLIAMPAAIMTGQNKLNLRSFYRMSIKITESQTTNNSHTDENGAHRTEQQQHCRRKNPETDYKFRGNRSEVTAQKAEAILEHTGRSLLP